MADALTSALMLDKLNKGSKAPRRRRRSSVKGSRRKKAKTTKHRKWKWMKTPQTGVLFKVAKEGYIQAPNGRYVRKTADNLLKYGITILPNGEIRYNQEGQGLEVE